MALAQRQEDDLHTPVTHYEILTEKLKDARIDKLEEVIIEKFNTVNERINSINNRIDALDRRLTEKITSTKNELLVEIKSTNARIHALDEKLTEQIKSTNTRIDSLEKSMNKSFTILTITLAIVGISIAVTQIIF